ncbi:SHOCT domain-containing protein [Fulvimarina sp. MAC8]|uniref:SHOCT domain-containing protein n=1 Tax=Fulvimarina sp. MAC8 TaxID=3162874 RepID=UPI0032EE2085
MDDAREIARISSSTGFSEDAVRAMAEALRAGNGTMAQFNHSELGGFGQWSAGGMLMIGDMFNNVLKGRVGTLADMVSGSLARGDLPMRTARSDGFGLGTQSQWWPEELGQPSSSGAQNGIRYAVFPGTARLAIETGGKVTVYDTGHHQIGGVSQQQGGTSSLRFSSQFGSIEPGDLKIVDGGTVEEAKDSRSYPANSSPINTGSQSQSAFTSAGPGNFQSQTQGYTPPSPAAAEASFKQEERDSAAEIDSKDASPALPQPEPESPPSAHRQEPILPEVPTVPQPKAPKAAPSDRAEKPAGDPLALLRGLAELKNEGILTEEEFAAKKAELLSRL